MIEISHLTKKHGKHVAVDDLTLNIESGKIYGFLGPNGAGKSTTMNMITGYLGATSGTIKIDGEDIFENPEKARMKIGYLPELPPLYQEMMVEEYLYFAAELKKIAKKERKAAVEEAMELTGVDEVSGRLIKNLSKGYKQRVGLAQAILGYPEVIILDEPTVGLDPKQIIEMRELIKKLGENHTVILSSHIMQEISAVCEYVFIISKGKLVAADTLENLENMNMPNKTFEVEIKGDRSTAEKMLEVMGQLRSFEIEETSEGYSKIKIHYGKDKSLEDVFLELTEGGESDAGDL